LEAIEFAKKTIAKRALYEPTKNDMRPYRCKKPLAKGYYPTDFRFLIDHDYIDAEGHLTQHPYDASMQEMKKLIELCEERGIEFDISGRSEYFPGATFKITFHPKDCPVCGERQKERDIQFNEKMKNKKENNDEALDSNTR
jgi:hypothetical protein